MSWEMVVGLETHIELSTKTKIFCKCTTEFGGEPNTQCCPVCVGLPGTLPKLNRNVVDYAIKAGLATNCKIRNYTKMDRKHYVYPDTPKAYQISQHDKALCEDGYISLYSGKKINIVRIHIEEDAGKLVHQHGNVYIDYNRSGIPLIEIVSGPDIRSVDEAMEYVEQLRLIMKYIGVSDVKMQEGSLRCDVNISVRKRGDEKFGTRVEIKNMNSINFIAKALEYEFKRQVDILENGGTITQETRRYNSDLNVTESMRGKEDCEDYRYFRDPDLGSIYVSDEEIEKIRNELPELPYEKLRRYIKEYDLPKSDAQLLIKYKKIAEYFEKACCGSKSYKTCANLILGPIFRRLPTDAEKEEANIPIPPEYLKEIAELTESKKITSSLAKNTFERMLDTGKPVHELLSKEDLDGIDESTLKSICEEAVKNNEKAVESFLKGKERALGVLIAYVMKETKGRAHADLARKFIEQIINE